jgi:hypothetical protein
MEFSKYWLKYSKICFNKQIVMCSYAGLLTEKEWAPGAGMWLSGRVLILYAQGPGFYLQH